MGWSHTLNTHIFKKIFKKILKIKILFVCLHKIIIMIVKSIDTNKVKSLLKECPKEVREYISALERSLKRQKELTQLAINKIKNNNYEKNN